MKHKNILLTALLTIALFAGVSYTACKKDRCQNVICLNLGQCDNGACLCPVGFEGDRCQRLSRDKFIKTFNGYDTCTIDTLGGHRQYPLYFRTIKFDQREMVMQNLLDDMDDSAICTIEGIDTFSFQGANNATTYFGTGKLRNDSLWLTYKVEQDTTTYECRYFGQGLR